MTQDRKVVSLKSQGLVDRFSLPPVLVRLRDVSGLRLRSVLSDFFDSADDVLFGMAEKAGSNQDQTAYFDAMRELRLRRKNMTSSMLQWVSQAFNELGTFDPVPNSSGLDQVDQDSLSLLDHDDMEQKLAIDGLITKLRNRHEQAVQLLAARVAHLVPNIDLKDRQMPLSPEVLCTGLAEACGDLEIDIRAKLIVLKLFDQLLISKLDELYREANELLVVQGILPELTDTDARLRRAGRPAKQGRRAPPPPSARGAVPPPAAPTDDQQSLISSGHSSATFSELSELLREGGLVTGQASAADSRPLDTQALMGMLAQLQPPMIVDDNEPVTSLSDQLQSLIRPDSGPAYSLRQVDSDVINLVSMLFDFILEDHQLPSPIKSLLGRLQIPVLKVALTDQSFFNRGGHPARKLLNELAMAGIGWVEKSPGQRDPLRDKIESVVDQLAETSLEQPDELESLLDDFSRFMDLDRRRRALIEQRLRDAEEGRAIQERARQTVDQLLADTLSGRELPQPVVDLLQQPWCKYLQWLVLREGSESEAWHRAVTLTRQLVWSVDPEPIDENTRSELLATIPTIVDGLRDGLQTISWDPFATDNAVRDLELAHVDVFQRLVTQREAPVVESEPEAPVAAEPEPEVEAPEAEAAAPDLPAETADAVVDLLDDVPLIDDDVPEVDDVAEVVVPEVTVSAEPVAEASPAAAIAAESTEPAIAEEWLAKADHLPVGSWVEMLSQDNRIRCKLAAYIKVTGKFIFVNRNGAKVAELQREELARALASKEITMLDDGLIFDRALESIIDNLRTNRRD